MTRPATRGFAYWLTFAPPTASFREVVTAYNEYDSPTEAWPDGAQPGEIATDGGRQ